MRIQPAGMLVGAVSVPGDKSISHRALLVGALCEDETVVTGWGRSADTVATLNAVRALGVPVHERLETGLRIEGRGLHGLRPPEGELDCANAGTLMRLLAGVLVGQEGRYVLIGDESLSKRPMGRIAEPLLRMGASVDPGPPLVVEGRPLHAIEYELPVASAQVKSAVLLAGLNATGKTTVLEPAPTRDHTELMLAEAGASVVRRPRSVSLDPPERLSLGELEVPGDFSSAAPFLVAATLLPGSELFVAGVGLNPRRTGLLDVLERMGARIAVFNRRRAGGELVGDLEVRSAELVATTITPEEVPRLVDELPLFALAAAVAHGNSAVRGAQELRVKETDRIETVTTSLRALGIRIEEREDGFRVRGVPTRPKGGGMHSSGDHRIAMLGAVAGLISSEGVELGEPEAVAVSFPGFYDVLESVTQR